MNEPKPLPDVLFPLPDAVKGYDFRTRSAMEKLKTEIAEFLDEVLPLAMEGEVAALSQRKEDRSEKEHDALDTLHQNLVLLSQLNRGIGDFLAERQKKHIKESCDSQDLVDYTARTALALLSRINVAVQNEDCVRELHGASGTITRLCYGLTAHVKDTPMVGVPEESKDILEEIAPWRMLFNAEQITRMEVDRKVPNYRPQLKKLILLANQYLETLPVEGMDEKTQAVYDRLKEIAEGNIPPKTLDDDKNSLMLYSATYKDNPLLEQIRQRGIVEMLDGLFTDDDRIIIGNHIRNGYHYAHLGVHQYMAMQSYFRKERDVLAQAVEVAAELKAAGDIGKGDEAAALLDEKIFKNISLKLPAFLDLLFQRQREEMAKQKPNGVMLEMLNRVETTVYTLMGDHPVDGAASPVMADHIETLYGLWCGDDAFHQNMYEISNEVGLSDALLPLFSGFRPASPTGMERNWENIAERFNHFLEADGIPHNQLPAGGRNGSRVGTAQNKLL